MKLIPLKIFFVIFALAIPVSFLEDFRVHKGTLNNYISNETELLQKHRMRIDEVEKQLGSLSETERRWVADMIENNMNNITESESVKLLSDIVTDSRKSKKSSDDFDKVYSGYNPPYTFEEYTKDFTIGFWLVQFFKVFLGGMALYFFSITISRFLKNRKKLG